MKKTDTTETPVISPPRTRRGRPMLTVPAELPALKLMERSGSWHRVAGWLVIAILLGLIGLAFTPWQQSVSGTGRVSALTPMERQQTIDAPIDGRIIKWYVVEGTRVKQGDPIADMADLDPSLPERIGVERTAALDRIRAITDRQAQLDTRVQELERTLRNDLSAADFRVQQAQDRLRAAEQALEAAQARRLVTEQNLNRHKLLFPKGLVSKRQLEVAEAEFTGAQADLERSRAQVSEARNAVQTVTAERARTLNSGSAAIADARASRQSAASELASAQQALQPIEVRINRQSTQTIKAPVDATVFRLAQQPGGAVIKAGEEIAAIVPDTSEMVTEVWVAGNDMPLISPGRKVRLQFEGWPAVQFVGWPSVAVGTFGGVVRLVDATDSGNGKFRVLVGPDPEDREWPDPPWLRQGVRAKGWVLLNVVPLGFEVWRQFNGFPPALSDPPDVEPIGGKKSDKK